MRALIVLPTRDLAHQVHRVFDAYVLNRLGSIPTIDRVLPMYHAALAELERCIALGAVGVRES